jgi:hypothetical protein
MKSITARVSCNRCKGHDLCLFDCGYARPSVTATLMSKLSPSRNMLLATVSRGRPSSPDAKRFMHWALKGYRRAPVKLSAAASGSCITPNLSGHARRECKDMLDAGLSHGEHAGRCEWLTDAFVFNVGTGSCSLFAGLYKEINLVAYVGAVEQMLCNGAMEIFSEVGKTREKVMVVLRIASASGTRLRTSVTCGSASNGCVQMGAAVDEAVVNMFHSRTKCDPPC